MNDEQRNRIIHKFFEEIDTLMKEFRTNMLSKKWDLEEKLREEKNDDFEN